MARGQSRWSRHQPQSSSPFGIVGPHLSARPPFPGSWRAGVGKTTDPIIHLRPRSPTSQRVTSSLFWKRVAHQVRGKILNPDNLGHGCAGGGVDYWRAMQGFRECMTPRLARHCCQAQTLTLLVSTLSFFTGKKMGQSSA